jgi:hypothetical protein
LRRHRVADVIFVLAPFVLAWRLTGWPTRHPRALVSYLGPSLMLLGASLLRLAIFGSLPPVHDLRLRRSASWRRRRSAGSPRQAG